LTGKQSQTSVEVSIEKPMAGRYATIRGSSTSWWRILTCLLLAGLFLYNPFLAVSRASGSLTVCRPESHRATVGCSELEELAQPNVGAAALIPNVAEVQALIPRLAASHPAPRHRVEQEVVATPQTGFSSSLWFRPPPAV
jgi:hypothetical protein